MSDPVAKTLYLPLARPLLSCGLQLVPSLGSVQPGISDLGYALLVEGLILVQGPNFLY